MDNFVSNTWITVVVMLLFLFVMAWVTDNSAATECEKRYKVAQCERVYGNSLSQWHPVFPS